MKSCMLIIEQFVPLQFLFPERPEYMNHEVVVVVVVVVEVVMAVVVVVVMVVMVVVVVLGMNE